MIKPDFRDYINQDLEFFITDMKNFIEKNPSDITAQIDLLRFYSKTRNFIEFEYLAKGLGRFNNAIIQREIGRFMIFGKKDRDTAKKYLEKAIELNKNEPVWVYYFAGKNFNYYEKLHDEILYTAIPKNASTSLKTFILENIYKLTNIDPHSQFGNPFFNSQHFSAEQIKKSKKILIVRDPIERVKSYFKMNIKEENSLNSEIGLVSENFDFSGLQTRPDFKFFIENIWDYCLVFDDVLHHILPQSAYIKSLDEYDIIADIKNLDSVVKEVSNYLNLEYNGPAPKKMTPRINKENISQDHDEFLKKIYLDDYYSLRDFYLYDIKSSSDSPLISFHPSCIN